tara:strand:+ start:19805 stop:20575 length:771 start_codon:yes stop_codon:yes gene_type:complete
MKVIILAGGYGTRLGNITESIPKPMVMVGNKPIIWHIMKIYSYYGFNDFIISLGYKSNVIKEYFYNYKIYNNDFEIDLGNDNIRILSNHSELEWKIKLVDTGVDTLKGARIKRLEKYLDDVNMVTYGDGISNININELHDFHKSHKKMLTISGVHPPARFGEFVEKDNRIISFEEKSDSSHGTINGGFMVFNKSFLEYLNCDENCDLEKGPFEELAMKSEIMLYKHTGKWACMDHERDVQYLNKLWKEDKAFWKVW